MAPDEQDRLPQRGPRQAAWVSGPSELNHTDATLEAHARCPYRPQARRGRPEISHRAAAASGSPAQLWQRRRSQDCRSRSHPGRARRLRRVAALAPFEIVLGRPAGGRIGPLFRPTWGHPAARTRAIASAMQMTRRASALRRSSSVRRPAASARQRADALFLSPAMDCDRCGLAHPFEMI
jgi:hypothetical protein